MDMIHSKILSDAKGPLFILPATNAWSKNNEWSVARLFE